MDYRRTDLNLLVVLDALLETGGVNATARKLGMSQPNVSFALAKLRLQFADALLVRVGNRMQPTSLAEELRDPLRRFLAVLEGEILTDRSFDPASSTRRYVISTSDIGELVFLPRLMKQLAIQAPHVTLECQTMAPLELARAMAEGRVDLALGYFPDLQGDGFLTQQLFAHGFTCIARQDHPVAQPGWSVRDFLALQHIVVAQPGRTHELFEGRLQELGLERRIQLLSPHFMSVPLLISGSDLISTVPIAVGELFATMAPLQLLAPPVDVPTLSIRQFWHRRVHEDRAVRWLRNLITRLFLNQDPPMRGLSGTVPG